MEGPPPPLQPRSAAEERALLRVDTLLPEMIDLLRRLVQIPTVNPPGEHYDAFCDAYAAACRGLGYRAAVLPATGHPDDSPRYPRVNVVARIDGEAGRPCVHFNGHLDVVPPGDGWTRDPFGAQIEENRLYGRGTCDMKAGLVASLFAVEALRRAGALPPGSVEQSATCDEESGGFAGVAHLAERGILAAGKQDHVIITEPLNPDRVCLGHRGVYWADVLIRGRVAHGSMPFLGESAIERMGAFVHALTTRLKPRLAARTTALPVVPDGARHATLNLNAIAGGQPLDAPQTPCVADRCSLILDRRFLPEEDLDAVRREIDDELRALGFPYELRDRMVVLPAATPADDPVVLAVAGAIQQVYGRPAALVASPGTYDQKHLVRIGKIKSAVAYGPGILDLAHQPDEYVDLDDLLQSARVMALATLRLLSR